MKLAERIVESFKNEEVNEKMDAKDAVKILASMHKDCEDKDQMEALKMGMDKMSEEGEEEESEEEEK